MWHSPQVMELQSLTHLPRATAPGVDIGKCKYLYPRPLSDEPYYLNPETDRYDYRTEKEVCT